MAAHRKSDRRRVYLCGVGLRKDAQESLMTHATDDLASFHRADLKQEAQPILNMPAFNNHAIGPKAVDVVRPHTERLVSCSDADHRAPDVCLR